MALKGDRDVIYDDISYFMSATGERGIFVTFPTGGVSGSIMDNTANIALIPGTGSQSGAKPVGLLMNDVVSIDLTRYHLNYQKDEVQANSKVRLGKKGWVVTNMITGTPAAGDVAYLAPLGKVTPTSGAGVPVVGRFLSAKDSDGYARVDFDIN